MAARKFLRTAISLKRMLPLVYFILAGAYIALQPRIYSGHFFLKASPILLLAAVVGFNDTIAAPFRWLLLAALLCSAAGDIFLAFNIDDSSDTLFIAGLGSFLVGHIFYALAFFQSVAFQIVSLLPIIFILVLAATLAWKIWPKLGGLKFPVLFYILVSGLMGVAASFHAPFSWILVGGAIIFMVSDSMIAVQKFWRPVPYSDFLVMSTYYIAQFLIFWGLTQ